MNTDDKWNELAAFVAAFTGTPFPASALVPICQGASGRHIARFRQGNRSYIAIFWTGERPDNNHFIPVARLLAQSGIRVPAILKTAPLGDGGMAVIQDLGDTNLLSLKNESWDRRRTFYIDALEQVDRLHKVLCPASFSLQPAFDEAMYRWEQEYFAEHFLNAYLGLDPKPFLDHQAAQAIAKTLAVFPKKPVHRDFQSQNVHIVDGQAWLIDFQGMRYGLPEYDLASIVFDPYACLEQDERLDLLHAWERITEEELNRERLIMCAQQRLMQALGAFAKLSRSGRTWYEPHIRPAVKSLCDISSTSWLAEPLSPVVECGILLE